MHEIFNMLLAVFDRAALMLICLFFLIRIRLFRELLHKSAHSPKELLAVTAIFSLFALFSTWSGVPVEGSLVNVRIIAVMSGGILFGPWVGIITGVIAGIHRYLIDIGGVTAIPCFITSILAGCISGWINLKIPKAQRWRVGILGGMLCETLTMILVIVWAPTTALGIDIVSKIGIPMILGSVCIGFIVLLVQSVEGEKEASAARQAKLALDIANKTLPLFRHVNSESLRKVCEIIRDDIHADAVAMTNTDHVLAYVGVGEHNYQNGDDFISPTTRQAMNYGKIIIKNNDEAHRTPEIHSMLVIPLWEKGVVTGTLKIYYCHAHQITSSLQEMAVGLSQIISTQLEVSRAEQLREMANKAELRALQSKINPHFLFNALNAISSSIRLNPDTARQLIFNLSRYLRYNIELKDDEQIDIKKEHPNVTKMKILGCHLIPVTRGTKTLKDAVDSAFEEYLKDQKNFLYAIGSVVGPHPFPKMVRDFQSIVGKEARAQFLARENRLPDVVTACVGGGSNAIGIFTEFLPDESVRLVGIEPAGKGLDTPDNAATLSLGKKGVLHGFKCYTLQDEKGELLPVYSIASGLDYPGVGPQHCYLKDIGRVEYEAITDKECLDAFLTDRRHHSGTGKLACCRLCHENCQGTGTG